jgi:presenilin-like A22 family membrane protease
MGDSLKPGPVHLIPILASVLFGTLCAFVVSISQMGFYGITPFPEGVGSFGNALYFVILTGVGASLLYVLLKRKSLKLVTLITGFALTAAVFMLSFIYLYAAFSIFSVPYMDASVLVLSIGATVLADFAVFQGHTRISSFVVLLLGGAFGAFLGISIPTQSTILILGFLAVYDVFTVYRGPVGKIAHVGLEQLRGLSFSFKDVQVGLGDLTFYSMLSGHVFVNFGSISTLAAMAGILSGCLISFKMLEKKGIFPGLPFPIFLGLAAGLLASLA